MPFESTLSFEQFLRFVELDEFCQDWQQLGMDIDADMWALQIAIMRNPALAPVIPGTGGLRKARFSSPRQQQGKRGAIRVCYAYFPLHRVVLLIMAYGKSEKATLSANEKQGIRRYLTDVERWLDKNFPPGK